MKLTVISPRMSGKTQDAFELLVEHARDMERKRIAAWLDEHMISESRDASGKEPREFITEFSHFAPSDTAGSLTNLIRNGSYLDRYEPE
jgi:hypothetical protein